MLKKIGILVAAGLLTATGGAGAGYASLNDQVSLSVDGAVSTEGTLAPTVGAYLTQTGIEIGQRDLVEPGLDVPIDGETTVSVRYGREIELSVDGTSEKVWTTGLTVDQALTELGYDETADVSPLRDTAIPRDGLAIEVGTEKLVELVSKGESTSVRTTGLSVQDALDDAGVTVGDDDTTEPALDAPLTDGMTITHVQVEKKTEKKKQDIDFKTEQVNSSTLDKGETKTLNEGKKGTRELTFEVIYEDGKEVKRTETDSKVLTEPVNKKIAVGTREEQEQEEEEPPSSGNSSESDAESDSDQSDSGGSGESDSDGSGGGSGGGSSESDEDKSDSGGSEGGSSNAGVWDKLAKCESGGNWKMNSGNGYYGGVQFSAETWKAMGGSGLPHENSKSEQIRVATKLQKAYGWGQWPACSAKLGLR